MAGTCTPAVPVTSLPGPSAGALPVTALGGLLAVLAWTRRRDRTA